MLFPSRLALLAGLLGLALGAAAHAQPQLNPQPPAAAPAPAVEAAPPADPLAAARRISAEDAKKAVAQGRAVLVDVRAKESYDQEHAKGALLLPVSEVAARAAELPKDKLIITYCT